MSSISLTLQLSGRIIPKARARVTANGTFLPPRYRQWKQAAQIEILSQLSGSDVEFPITKAAIYIQLLGPHRGDADNICGSVLDALVQAKILQDDRLSCLPELHIIHIPNGLPGALIELKSMQTN